jgi:hypothetical protein
VGPRAGQLYSRALSRSILLKSIFLLVSNVNTYPSPGFVTMPPQAVLNEVPSELSKGIPSRRLLGPAVKMIRAFFRTGDIVILEEQGTEEFGPIILARGPSVKHFLEEEGEGEEEDQPGGEDCAGGGAGGGAGSTDPSRARAKRSRAGDGGGEGGAGVSVSGHNRRRESERFKRAVKEITDVWRVNDDGEDVSVDTRELLRKYKTRFDYLLLRQGLTVPVDRASTIVRMADAVGGPKAMWDWRVVLEYWRAKGRLTSVGRVEGSAPPTAADRTLPDPSQDAAAYMLGRRWGEGPDLQTAIDGIWTMYQATERTESCGLIHRIHERLRLAALYEQYEMACQMVDGKPYGAILRALAGSRRMKVSSAAKDEMFRQLYVRMLLEAGASAGDWSVVGDAGEEDGRFSSAWVKVVDSDHAKLQRGRFERKLKRGGRWFSFTSSFGRFALAMVP